MEASDTATQVNQSENSSAETQEESSVKSTPVSVIQPAPQSSPAKVNGSAEPEDKPAKTEDKPAEKEVKLAEKEEEAAAEKVTNGTDKPQEGLEELQQPSEQVPAQLLQGDNGSAASADAGATTVASLIDQEDAAEDSVAETPAAKTETESGATTATTTPKQAPPAKPTATDLAAEWEEEGDVDMKDAEAPTPFKDTVPPPAEPEDKPVQEEQPTEQENQASEEKTDEATPRKSGRKVKPTEKVLEGDNYVEESVEAIANELANSAVQKKGKAADTSAAADDDEKKAAASARKGRPKKKDLDEKVDNVTKLGNNMYFYTGPGGQDSPPPLNSDDEGEGSSPSKEKAPEASRKSNRAGKGRNPRLEREDEEVEIPKKLPPKPNLNPSWLKDAQKAAADKKSPAKKKGGAPAPAAASTPGTPAPAKVEKSPSTPATPAAESDAANEGKDSSPPKDEELPEFDPNKFTKGYVPKTVKKGDDEYVVIVQGVQDTGLCGKYWGDTNLPSRRRSKAPEAFKAGDSPDPNRVRRGSSGSTGSSNADTPVKTAPKKQDTPAAVKANKKQVTKPETPKAEPKAQKEAPAENGETPAAAAAVPDSSEKKKAGRKRKVEADSPAPASATDKKIKQETPTKSPEKAASSLPNKSAVTQALAAGSPAGQQRGVSCVSDTSSQKEVVVECFAPYDDHRWVNIGKDRDGMAPDAVQYARALRPPYHLLSFLRIKGHSTKGMSCTDKNTMVFVVLEGEITVILHTTQFNAKKGDSFYIPPKNYYNLINQKAREAELSLIQFQYDGPLPTVSQSAAPAATSSAASANAAAPAQ